MADQRANRANPGTVEREAVARCRPEDAFAVASSYDVRLSWDPFVRSQHLVGTDTPGKGVLTVTRSRHGLKMITQYLTYRPPTLMGMAMVKGPAMFGSFSGSWRFVDASSDEASGDAPRTRIVFRYRFETRPRWLQWLMHPVGRWYLGRDIERRVAAFVRGCEDPELRDRALAEVASRTGEAAG